MTSLLGSPIGNTLIQPKKVDSVWHLDLQKKKKLFPITFLIVTHVLHA